MISPDATIITALAEVESKLTAALNSGLAQVNAAITSLTQAHHEARLEQERRNATFATLDRLDALASRVEQHTAQLESRGERLAAIGQAQARQERLLEELERVAAERSSSFLQSTNGYLVSALLVFAGTVLSFVLFQLVK